MLKQCIYCDSVTHVSRQLLICFTLSLSIVLRLAMFIPAECCKHLQTSANIPKLQTFHVLLRLCCETALVNDPGVDDRRGTAGEPRTQSTWSSVETVRFRLCWTVSANEVAKPKLERHSMSDCYLLLSTLIFSVAPDRSRAFLYFLTCVLLCSAVTPTLSAPVDCPIEFWSRIHMENFLSWQMHQYLWKTCGIATGLTLSRLA